MYPFGARLTVRNVIHSTVLYSAYLGELFDVWKGPRRLGNVLSGCDVSAA